MRRFRLPAGALLAALLTGCGWFSDDKGVFVDRRDDYLDARAGERLEVPTDLKAVELADPFPIPPVPEPTNPQYFPDRPPLPDPIYANDRRQEVRIQRLGERRWVVVPEPPTTVWPKVKQFFAENGVSFSFEEPARGRLSTQWLTIRPGAEESYRDVVRTILQEARSASELNVGRDRLLLRIEQGLQPLTSEIHVRHENDSLDLPDDRLDLNRIQSSVPQAETDALRELGAYVAAKVSEQSVSMVAQVIATTPKAALERDGDGWPVLRLNLDYDRAWAALEQALKNAEVEVLAEDRGAGVFEIALTEAQITGVEASSGFFSRWFGGDEEAKALAVQLNGDRSSYAVSVHDPAGQRLDRQLSQQILNLIREFAG